MTEASAPLKSYLKESGSEVAYVRMWHHIEHRRRFPQVAVGDLARLAMASAAATCLLLVLGMWALEAPEHATADNARANVPALTLSDGRALSVSDVAEHAPAASLALSDGSQIQVHTDSRVEASDVSSDRLVLNLPRGSATFDVRPGGPRRWFVEAGIATVEVVGTRFSVHRAASRVRISVERGVVLVHSDFIAESVRRLGAGESLVVGDPTGTSERATAPQPATARPPASPVPREASNPPRPAARDSRGSPWLHEATQGNYVEAFASLGAAGLRSAVDQASSAAELLKLADVARLSGHSGDAVLPLRRIQERFPSSAEAPLAGMTLGRTLLALGRATEAASALEQSISAGLPSGLLEDAFVRLAQAYVRAGDPAGAHSALERYEARFTGGRRSAEIRNLLSGSQ